MDPQKSGQKLNHITQSLKSAIKTYPTEPTKTYLPTYKNYAQEAAIILGVGLLMLGFIGLVVNDLFGAHLSFINNSLHVITGALSIWFGFDNFKSAKRVCFIFGSFYGIMGILGFLIGNEGLPTVGHLAADRFLWRILPRVLEFGFVDHTFHCLLGGLFLTSGALNFKSIKKI